ncbi:short chain dehydrogenase, partial [bacterium]|nr:short chain dehydrogenase [bacterium]
NTAALAMIPGVDPKLCRTPEILADAAYAIFRRDSRAHTGNFYIDDEVLTDEGVTNLGKYSVVPGNNKFLPDFFID